MPTTHDFPSLFTPIYIEEQHYSRPVRKSGIFAPCVPSVQTHFLDTSLPTICFCVTMSRVFITSSTAGALFGAALASSGVYLPSVIISQMRLSSFHMLKAFITASASSA
jgi:hypothetical protein